jgi:stage IV sporulation protein A
MNVKNDRELMDIMCKLAETKSHYDRIKDALEQVEATGYGIVMPTIEELKLEAPEIMKQGGRYGVRLKASAPSIHLMKANISTEVSPIVGSEKQAEDLAATLKKEMEESDEAIWQTNIFGKTMYEMVSEQMQNKITSVPDNVRTKMQKSLQKISDEGKEYFICIVI